MTLVLANWDIRSESKPLKIEDPVCLQRIKR